jgi:predicted hydrolase (HD superfamily)
MHVSDRNFVKECIKKTHKNKWMIKNINEDNVTHVTTGYKLWLPWIISILVGKI